MRHANNLKIYLALISRDQPRAWILNICLLSNGPFLNLGVTCFRTDWRARANFRRLLLWDSPSSQPPTLPKFNFGTASPTRWTNYSVLENAAFSSTFVHKALLQVFEVSWPFEFRNGDAMLPASLPGAWPEIIESSPGRPGPIQSTRDRWRSAASRCHDVRRLVLRYLLMILAAAATQVEERPHLEPEVMWYHSLGCDIIAWSMISHYDITSVISQLWYSPPMYGQGWLWFHSFDYDIIVLYMISYKILWYHMQYYDIVCTMIS